MRRVVIIISLLFLMGCSQAPTSPTPSSINTGYTSFLGVDLGMDEAQVKAKLGNGTYSGARTSIQYYTYGLSGDKMVGYYNDAAFIIITSNQNLSLDAVMAGNTYSTVVSKWGRPDSTDTTSSTTAYYCYWNDKNLTAWFYTSTDISFAIGIVNI